MIGESDFYRRHPLTTAMFVLCLALYPFILLSIVLWGIDTVAYWFIFSPGLTPEPSWILSLFAHVSPAHLFVNVGALLLLGSYLEERIPRTHLFLVFIATGLGSGLLHANLTGTTGAGASGAILGWGGLYSVYFLSREWTGEATDRWEAFRFAIAVALPFAVAAEFVLGSLTGLTTANHAHLWGMVLGLLIGWPYLRWIQ
ncbi:Peptidase S54, rhomboid domain protein [Salinarchaeum sp. Harcht-Bsk1]|uniref:rhomboid family intramembrane serine protease n=1 Tax=Salinarchaeum sp. Harcht-Bsk1 TaxID=1333523 RepID=UPI00034236A1|nr:rhomboid family intramembrane serine protease [Salinarchaeum sp. Harcht-Bsk1]AGN02828.1 Peptidase S54, rhomboid domain protein [Salinarchaeum sp. Harcht-Bsk1]